MKKVKLIYRSYYRSKQGNVVYVYTVSGTQEAIADYVDTQGANIRYLDNDETKAPLYFSNEYIGKTGVAIKPTETSTRFVIENLEREALLSMANSLTRSNPKYAEVFMNVAANRLFDKIEANNTSVAVEERVVNTTPSTPIVPPGPGDLSHLQEEFDDQGNPIVKTDLGDM